MCVLRMLAKDAMCGKDVCSGCMLRMRAKDVCYECMLRMCAKDTC